MGERVHGDAFFVYIKAHEVRLYIKDASRACGNVTVITGRVSLAGKRQAGLEEQMDAISSCGGR
ncbi:hypothetical protein H4217_008535 [Coemansia sp. RSA 1939]|nr:hypothetical protein H4217_008535 [Coemansia sp. RSA 1939]